MPCCTSLIEAFGRKPNTPFTTASSRCGGRPVSRLKCAKGHWHGIFVAIEKRLMPRDVPEDGRDTPPGLPSPSPLLSEALTTSEGRPLCPGFPRQMSSNQTAPRTAAKIFRSEASRTMAPSAWTGWRTMNSVPLPPFSSSTTISTVSVPRGRRPNFCQHGQQEIDDRDLPFVVTCAASKDRCLPDLRAERIHLVLRWRHNITVSIEDQAPGIGLLPAHQQSAAEGSECRRT